MDQWEGVLHATFRSITWGWRSLWLEIIHVSVSALTPQILHWIRPDFIWIWRSMEKCVANRKSTHCLFFFPLRGASVSYCVALVLIDLYIKCDIFIFASNIKKSSEESEENHTAQINIASAHCSSVQERIGKVLSPCFYINVHLKNILICMYL